MRERDPCGPELEAVLDRLKRLEAERSLAMDVLERGDAVAVLDRELRLVLVNGPLERLFRRRREEMIGRGAWEVFAADPGARCRVVCERVMRERLPESFEERCPQLDVWASVSIHPTPQGGIAVFVRDVSVQRRAMEALREQEALASRILASSLNGIYVADVHLKAPVFVNARYTQLTGYDLDDLRSMPRDLVEELVHPEDRARLREHMAAMSRARNGEVRDVEYRLRAKDGRWLSCFCRETPFVRSSDGEVRQIIGTFEDRTEFRRAEEAARDSEGRYRSLFESMTEGFALLEIVPGPEGRPSCRFAEVNPAFERLTGLSRDEVLDKLLRDVAGSDDDFWVATHERIALTGEPVRLERRSEVLRRDYQVYAFSPRPKLLALLFVDITERKRVEQELVEADRRKNEFLGVLSHEIRNPLAAVRHALHIVMRSSPGSPQSSRALGVIQRQTEQLMRLVDDLLDVTRISRGKIVLARRRVDARDIVLRVCEDHEPLFERNGVELRTEVADEPAWVDADPARLAQILGNLVQNAAKFTPAGGRVVVEAGPRGGRLELRVRDTGVGIEPELVGQMFEPFVQAERGLARTAGGLGLGLTLVKGLVELHGGTVSARSEGPGRGTEVSVALPLAAPPSAAESDVRSATGPTGRLVLVIEDNADAREALALVLELAGHRVRTAPDGRTGIALARELRPDVVICDIGLPDMPGYEVARALRQDEALRGTRLVALSGYAQPEHRREALDAGFDVHLAKPAPVEALDEALAP